MVIDELIQRLQKLSHAGFGAHEVMVAMNASEARVGFIGKVLGTVDRRNESRQSRARGP